MCSRCVQKESPYKIDFALLGVAKALDNVSMDLCMMIFFLMCQSGVFFFGNMELRYIFFFSPLFSFIPDFLIYGSGCDNIRRERKYQLRFLW